jgi:hypothetical protein
MLQVVTVPSHGEHECPGVARMRWSRISAGPVPAELARSERSQDITPSRDPDKLSYTTLAEPGEGLGILTE